MDQRKGSVDTIPATRDAVFDDNDVYQEPIQKQKDAIIEQADEMTETKTVELTQDEKDMLKLKEMLQMMDNLESKYKSVEQEYVQDRESAKAEIGIEKQLQKMEQLQQELESAIQSEKENIENADIAQDYQTGKDDLLLSVISQLQVVQTQNEAQQKILIEKEKEEQRKKDDKILELELMIKKLKEENLNIQQAQSMSQSKFEPQSEEINDSPKQIKKKQITEVWLPQNEVNSNEFSYFSNTTANKVKLKPIHKSTIPHYEYIPPAKTNIMQNSLNRELYKVAQSNRNVFLQAIKVDGTQRQNTPLTKSSEKYKQVFNTPHSEPAIGNKYRIKKLNLPQTSNTKNIFSNHLSTESLLFSRNGNFLQNPHSANINYNQPAKKNSLQHIRDMNDFFFEKPNSQQYKNY